MPSLHDYDVKVPIISRFVEDINSLDLLFVRFMFSTPMVKLTDQQ